MSFFQHLEKEPDDPILGLGESFHRDPRIHKVNLGIGAYQDAEGKPYVLSCVRKAEDLLLAARLDKQYPPIIGPAGFLEESLQLLFGSNSPLLRSNTIAAAQTVGGTGALRIGGEFLRGRKIADTLLLSDPTWPNHTCIFQQTGVNIACYPYYDAAEHALNFPAMANALANAAEKAVILMQPSCHNPTGVAPTLEQWKELSFLCKKKRLIPFFDVAYQGFDKGLDDDVQAVRLFAEEGHEMLIASSFSKNLGLYGERAGLLAIICKNPSITEAASSHLKRIIRGSYSMPPLHPQRIVTTVLQSEALRSEWQEELSQMNARIKEMRNLLLSALRAKSGSEIFDFLEKQTGMFSFTGLSKHQIDHLKEEFGVYIPSNGRINIAGLTMKNIDFVAEAILAVVNR